MYNNKAHGDDGIASIVLFKQISNEIKHALTIYIR